MVKIHNSELQREVIDGAKLQVSQDSVPDELADKVLAVMEVNPKLIKSANIIESTIGAAGTVYTTPENKDFYLCTAQLSRVKVVGDAGSTAYLRCTIDGQSRNLLIIPGVTLTADSQGLVVDYKHPLKLDRGTNVITIGSNHTAIAVCLTGYTIEEI